MAVNPLISVHKLNTRWQDGWHFQACTGELPVQATAGNAASSRRRAEVGRLIVRTKDLAGDLSGVVLGIVEVFAVVPVSPTVHALAVDGYPARPCSTTT